MTKWAETAYFVNFCLAYSRRKVYTFLVSMCWEGVWVGIKRGESGSITTIRPRHTERLMMCQELSITNRGGNLFPLCLVFFLMLILYYLTQNVSSLFALEGKNWGVSVHPPILSTTIA